MTEPTAPDLETPEPLRMKNIIIDLIARCLVDGEFPHTQFAQMLAASPLPLIEAADAAMEAIAMTADVMLATKNGDRTAALAALQKTAARINARTQP